MRKPHQRRITGNYLPGNLLSLKSLEFNLALNSSESYFGILKIDHVMFPANLNQYLNLSLAVAKVCSLAQNNAKITETLRSEIKQKENLIVELQQAISDVKTLRGIIPICAYCKQIRNDKGAWSGLEQYILKHSDAAFSHGVCPDCYQKELDKMNED